MDTFRFIKTYISYERLDVEAETEEEAWKLARASEDWEDFDCEEYIDFAV